MALVNMMLLLANELGNLNAPCAAGKKACSVQRFIHHGERHHLVEVCLQFSSGALHTGCDPVNNGTGRPKHVKDATRFPPQNPLGTLNHISIPTRLDS
jgi:hypothetical protein